MKSYEVNLAPTATFTKKFLHHFAATPWDNGIPNTRRRILKNPDKDFEVEFILHVESYLDHFLTITNF